MPRAAALRGLPFPPRTSTAPTPLTALVGRDRELSDLERLLSQRRLVTLTGPGGTGKTRLATELARAASRPVAWVELAGEQVWPVPPLSLPAGEAASSARASAAVELFGKLA